MAQCPKDGTVVNLSDPSVAKTCDCPVCGAWVYPRLILTTDKTSLEFSRDTTFGLADIRGLDGHDSVSRTHARFYPTEEGWSLVPLSTTKSSGVNGKPASPFQTIPLHDGDQVKLGTISFLVNFKEPPS
jgi:pSer/pThr/pTyr-binding forkhead associated (FHA) protein